MPYIAAIGHRFSLQEFLDEWNFEDLDDAELALDEAGITIFTNDNDDVFLVNSGKYKIINEENKYFDLNFNLTQEEENILITYTGKTDKRVKLFWIESPEEEIQNLFEKMAHLSLQKEDHLSINNDEVKSESI